MDGKPAGFPTSNKEVSEAELQAPTFATVFKVIWVYICGILKERQGLIICSSFLAFLLWGTHGKMEWLGLILGKNWKGPGIDIGQRTQLLPGIPWDVELISFVGGFLFFVVMPMLLIKYRLHQPMSDFGLGLPPKGRRRLALWAFGLLTVIGLLPILGSTSNAAMIDLYPIYHPLTGSGMFVIYELTYLPFFIAIEFMFRGYLLLGLAGPCGEGAATGRTFYFGKYAVIIAMLPYLAWHLGKPGPEMFGALVWGFAAGAIVYEIRSIWPIAAAHWLLNVFLDASLSKLF